MRREWGTLQCQRHHHCHCRRAENESVSFLFSLKMQETANSEVSFTLLQVDVPPK